MVRVLVCGSRDWSDRSIIRLALASLMHRYRGKPITIIHGAAKGADTIAATIASDFAYGIEAYPADWANLGRRAGPIRNQLMLDSGVDLWFAFQLDHSRGTQDMLDRLQRAAITGTLWRAPSGGYPNTEAINV